jgi:hypothetical protein
MNAVVPQGQISNYTCTFSRNAAAAGLNGAALKHGTCAWSNRPVASITAPLAFAGVRR